MTVTIWHNPRCSKSRQTLALLTDRGLVPEVRLYLNDPPSVEEIEAALAALGKTPADIVRTGETAFKALGLTRQSAPDALVAAMAAEPILIERPIVFAGGAARIGRPHEAVLDIP